VPAAETDYEVRKARIMAAVSEILDAVGEEPSREGLLDTPRRVAEMYLDIFSGLRTEGPKITTFDRGQTDQMVVVGGLDYASFCEHHLVPFTGQVHIGYVPDKEVVGLSKLGRIAEWYAKRPQIQENLTSQIADHVMSTVRPRGVIVVVTGSHACMSMRGIKKPNHKTITTAIRGSISKEEFFQNLGITEK
jgi:GTP cyclohydrolase I